MSSQARQQEGTPQSFSSVRAILLDIEGTTTPFTFVHEVLFPLARSRVKDFLAAHVGDPETEADIASLRRQHAIDVENKLDPPTLTDATSVDEAASIVAYVHWLIDGDRKSTALKSLQGRIWREGYADGSLKAPIFSDVVPALERWRRDSLKVGIFSSGSTLAQQLLFSHTERGDLTHLIDNYFDTTVGMKTASDSYRLIASALQRPASEVLFISDVVAELDAAHAAGLQTLQCVRPGNPPQFSNPPQFAGRHHVIRSFDEVHYH